ncbi:MAG: DNA double-strand break repair nuclease NurA, partial [bacterium]
IKKLQNQEVIPSWDGDLCATVKIDSEVSAYQVLAVDGSQIYPDHHMADVSVCLINCGGCLLSYGQQSCAMLFSEPDVFLPHTMMPKYNAAQFSSDLVDLKREELEFLTMLERADSIAKDNKDFICLFDGSLIFWHLESKHKEIKDFFLNRYLEILDHFYRKKILVAGYLSFPQSRELIRLVKIWLCQHLDSDGTPCTFENEHCPCSAIGQMVDAGLIAKFLEPGFRTNLFYSHSKIIDSYPDHLKPCFFYLNVGPEIVRIELPKWIAQDPKAVDFIGTICLDQSKKGYGYPVALAEAHNQAVVTAGDRDFFYHLIRKTGINFDRLVLYSQKLIKKRGMKL